MFADLDAIYDGFMDTAQLLDYAISRQASDLHIVAGVAPIFRIHGHLQPLAEVAPLTPDICRQLVFSLLSEEQKATFLKSKELDFAYEHKGGIRFRVNAYHQQGKVTAALRLLNSQILTVEQLKLPQILHQTTNLKQGFVLVTGPTGSGKSTTLAAMIDQINTDRAEHILTIEDPIEYVYKSKKSVVTQRELGHDTLSWEMALRSSLREDPDVVLVGEMRDHETIAAALTVAETGHLVFATLHTNSAAKTIDRIIDVFPENQQPQVRNQLAASLEAVFAQRLVPTVDGGRVPVLEIMLASSAIRSVIRDGKTHQIDNIIQTSAGVGMMTFESSLLYWVKAGVIDTETAKEYALRPEEFMRSLNT